MIESKICTIEDLIFGGNQDPDLPAIESPGYQPLTYRELRMQITSFVKTLNSMGFSRNDRIAVILPGGPEMAVALLCVEAGFTAAPLNPEYKEHEYEMYFSKLGINGIIVQKDYHTAARNVARSRSIPVIEIIPLMDKAGRFDLIVPVSADTKDAIFALPSDTALLLLTSGTTSIPKTVPFSQEQICEITRTYLKSFHKEDPNILRFLHCVTFYHAIGILGSFIGPLSTGGTVICVKNFIAPDFIHLVNTYQPTYYWAVPALHQSILLEIKKNPAKVKNNSLMYTGTGAATLPVHVRNELETLLNIPVIEVYGMTEAAFISINVPYKLYSVGIPVIEYLAVLDDNGNNLPVNQEGEILVKGKLVFSGYENAPEENKAAFMNGWYKTGDMGYIDNEGYLFLTGRKKELINKGGEKVSPAEIDAVLQSHTSVKEAMAFRISDPVLGEDIAAMVVVTNPEVTEQELRMYVLDRLVQFKVPRRIHFVEKIPRTPTGKPQRYAGTQWHLDHQERV